MADKRAFSPKFTESDDFLSMKPTAQNLYFHFGTQADVNGDGNISADDLTTLSRYVAKIINEF